MVIDDDCKQAPSLYDLATAFVIRLPEQLHKILLLELADVNAIEMDQPKTSRPTLQTVARYSGARVAPNKRASIASRCADHLHAPNFREQKRMPRATRPGRLPRGPVAAHTASFCVRAAKALEKSEGKRSGAALTSRGWLQCHALKRLYSFCRSPASTRSEQKFSAWGAPKLASSRALQGVSEL